MKQAILPALILMTFAFVSCKKTYTCSCESSTGVEIKSETLKVKDFDEAKSDCEAINNDYSKHPAGVTCKLK